MEQLIVTPIKPYQLRYRQTRPFFMIGVVDIILVLLVATLWFGVPWKGAFCLSSRFVWSSRWQRSAPGCLSLRLPHPATSDADLSFSLSFTNDVLSGFVFPIEKHACHHSISSLTWSLWDISLLSSAEFFLKGVWPERALGRKLFFCSVSVLPFWQWAYFGFKKESRNKPHCLLKFAQESDFNLRHSLPMKFCASFKRVLLYWNDQLVQTRLKNIWFSIWVQYPDAFVVIPGESRSKTLRESRIWMSPQGDMTNTSLLAAKDYLLTQWVRSLKSCGLGLEFLNQLMALIVPRFNKC